MEDLKSSIQSWLDDNVTDLDDGTAETIFGRYLTNMAPTFPVVVFAPGTTAADVRSDNPLLFLAILDVASSGFCALETQRKLRKLIVQAYVHCMLRTDQYNHWIAPGLDRVGHMVSNHRACRAWGTNGHLPD